MSDERKKSSAGFWTVVALSLLLLYPLSFGPACWIVSRVYSDPPGMPIAYLPLAKLWDL